MLDSTHSPIHRVPTEILLSIFTFLPVSLDILDTRTPPWTVSQVSSRFRIASAACPTLWSTITIKAPLKYPLSHIQHNLPLALHRSQPLGINLSLVNGPGATHAALGTALDILLEHANRWLDVGIVNVEDRTLDDLANVHRFSALKSLRFSAYHPSPVTRHFLYSLLSTSHTLDSLDLHLEFRGPPLLELTRTMDIARWEKLADLKMRIPADWAVADLLLVIKLAKNISSFSVSDYAIRWAEAATSPLNIPSSPSLADNELSNLDDEAGLMTKPTVLRELTTLELHAKSTWTFHCLLSNVTLPKLKDLSLSTSRYINAHDFIHPLSELIQRSGLVPSSGNPDTIRKFRYSSAGETGFVDILNVMGGLEELAVSGIHADNTGRGLFEMLRVNSSASGTNAEDSSPILCPRLARLELPIPHVDFEALTTLLEERKNTEGVDSVDTISLLSSSCIDQDELERKLVPRLVNQIIWRGRARR